MSSSWNKDWLELQKQYVDVLTSFASSVKPQASTGTTPPDWQKSLEQLWQTKLFDLPGDPQAIFSSLSQHANSWQYFSEQFNDLLIAMSDKSGSDTDWQRALKDQIEKMKTHLQNASPGLPNDFWKTIPASGLDGWQQLFNGLFSGIKMPNPGPFTEFQRGMEKLTPFGDPEIAQKMQQGMQEGLRLWQIYQQNYQAYQQTLNKIDLSSLDEMQEKILKLADNDKSISSLRGLYDLWVDSHEQAYRKIILTEDYSKLYGELVNSLLKFKSHTGQLLAEAAKTMNLSSADEQEAMQQELDEIRKQQQKDKQRIKLLEDKIQGLTGASPAKKKAGKSKKSKTGKKKIIRKKTVPRSGRDE